MTNYVCLHLGEADVKVSSQFVRAVGWVSRSIRGAGPVISNIEIIILVPPKNEISPNPQPHIIPMED